MDQSVQVVDRVFAILEYLSEAGSPRGASISSGTAASALRFSITAGK